MGAGRKTSTYEYDHKAAQAGAAFNFEARQRNLGEALGGCIFGCTNETMAECLNDLVFGLPRPHWCYVQWISKDSPIFLFNYNTRELRGIFRAETDGTYEIKPDGWCKIAGNKTLFPSQVKVSNYCECLPLTEREYKPLLKECFPDNDKMLFELKRQEAQALCRAFDEKTNGRRSQARPMPNATGADTQLAKEQKKPFRPASPPAVPAWGAGSSSAPSQTSSDQGNAAATAKPQAPPQKPPDFSEQSSFPALPAKKQAIASPPKQASDGWGIELEAEDSKSNGIHAAKAEAKPAEDKVQTKQKSPAKPISRIVKEAAQKRKEAGKAQTSSTIAPSQAQKAEASDPELLEPVKQKALPWQPEAGPSGGKKEPVSSAKPTDFRPGLQTADAAAPNGAVANSSNGPPSDYVALVNQLHEALQDKQPYVADSLCQLLRLVKDGLDQGVRDRYSLAQVCDIFRKENIELTNLVVQQTNAIEVLKEEAAALRRDLAFVGNQINVTVSPVNQYLEDLPPLPALSNPPTAPEQSTEPIPHMLGIGPTAEGLLMFGGNNSTGWVDNIDAFVPSSKQWTRIFAMPKIDGHWAATSMSGHVYLAGGGSTNSCSNTCLRYDFPTNDWFEMAPMGAQRRSLAAVALDGKVYALGGGEPGLQLNTAEILDPHVNIWMKCKSLNSPRFATAASVLDSSIYAVGGFDGKTYLSSAERYDPRDGRWHKLPNCVKMRGGHTVVTVGQQLWVMGGWDNNNFQDSVEIFDTQAGKWMPFKDMKMPHAYFAAAQLDGLVYAVAGMQERQKFNDIVEYYDPPTKKWRAFYLEQTSDDKFSRLRAFAGACKYEH